MSSDEDGVLQLILNAERAVDRVLDHLASARAYTVPNAHGNGTGRAAPRRGLNLSMVQDITRQVAQAQHRLGVAGRQLGKVNDLLRRTHHEHDGLARWTPKSHPWRELVGLLKRQVGDDETRVFHQQLSDAILRRHHRKIGIVDDWVFEQFCDIGRLHGIDLARLEAAGLRDHFFHLED